MRNLEPRSVLQSTGRFLSGLTSFLPRIFFACPFPTKALPTSRLLQSPALSYTQSARVHPQLNKSGRANRELRFCITLCVNASCMFVCLFIYLSTQLAQCVPERATTSVGYGFAGMEDLAYMGPLRHCAQMHQNNIMCARKCATRSLYAPWSKVFINLGCSVRVTAKRYIAHGSVGFSATL